MYGFKDYPDDALLIDSLWSRLDPIEREFRLALLNAIIDAGGPIGAADVDWEPTQHGGATAEECFAALEAKHVIVVESGLVQFAYPVSALATNHTVHLADGRSFSAMCAIDAMGAALTLGQDTRIEDRCGVCGESITVRVENGRLASVDPATAHAIHADLSATVNWAASC